MTGYSCAALFLQSCAGSLPLKADIFPSLADQTDPSLGVASSLTKEYDYMCRIEGTIPEQIRGTLYRNTVALFERNGLRKRTMLDGDGMVQSFRFSEKGAHYRNRFVRTEKYLDESKAGRFLYPTFSTQAPGGWWNNFWPGSRVKSHAQISVYIRNNKLYAFDESSIPYELDPETLATIGPSRFGLAEGMSIYGAHSKIDPVTDEWILFGLHFGKDVTLHVTIFHPDGSLKLHKTFSLPRYVYIHDFFATEKYLVFTLHPAYISYLGFLFGLDSMADGVRWKPDQGNVIMIVDRSLTMEPVMIETDPRFMWHSLNSFDSQDKIIADFVGYDNPDHFLGPDPPFFAMMEGRKGSYIYPGVVRRYIIDPVSKMISEDILLKGNHDWPMINRNLQTRQHRFGYFARARGDDYLWSGMTRLDTVSGQVDMYDFDTGVFCGEPIFVPVPGHHYISGASDEPGWIVSLCYNGNTKKSFVAVFRADRLSDGPIAFVHMDHHSPFSMHGFWYPDWQHSSNRL